MYWLLQKNNPKNTPLLKRVITKTSLRFISTCARKEMQLLLEFIKKKNCWLQECGCYLTIGSTTSLPATGLKDVYQEHLIFSSAKLSGSIQERICYLILKEVTCP